MRILTVYNDPNGHTWFGEEKVDLRGGATNQMQAASRVSSAEPCKRFYITELSPGYSSGNDFSSRRQICVLLEGVLEIRMSDGAVRQVKSGDIVRLEDTGFETPGRSMRVLGDTPVRVLVLQLE